jgi:hypothetical protein
MRTRGIVLSAATAPALVATYAWTWGPFSCTGDPALVTDWTGTPTKTYGEGYKAHLLTRP